MLNLFVLDYIFLLISFLIGIYFYFTKDYDFFKKKLIPYEKPYPIFGSMAKVFLQKMNGYEYSERIYKSSKKNNGLIGMFELRNPFLVLGTEELVKLATVKDFDHFTDHRPFTSSGSGVFQKNLFALKGVQWKNMRAALSPAFTPSKLRYMFEFVNKCALQMDAFLGKEIEKQKSSGQKGEIIIKQEMKELFTRFAADAIATSVFGIEIDSLIDRENDFFLMGKDLTDISSGLRPLKFILALSSPFISKFIFRSQLFSPVAINYFSKIVTENLEKRRKEKIVRPDMINLLMEAQANKNNLEELTDDDIIAQAIIFFFAGFDTISTTLSVATHQLAEFPEVQEKLIQEIDKKLEENNGVITYDILMNDMPYLEMVLLETQRRIPAVADIQRVCTKRYTFPAQGDRQEYTIHPGQYIWIPIYGFHRDAKYFPDPDNFIPERWSDKSQHDPNVYMPFGIGPRICIGNRFARLEVKLAIFNLLKNFRLIFIKETQTPLRIVTKALNVHSERGFWLGLKPRH